MTEVKVRRLCKQYKGQRRAAVDHFDVDCSSGAMIALLGPSGCGKTTILSMIAGVIQPDSGDVLFDGRSILSLPPEKRFAAMVFQQSMLFPHMSVADNISFGLRMRRLPSRDIARQVDEMLEYIRLPDTAHSRPVELSGGQQQRVALARALIIKPRVLLMDEPLASLDPHLRGEMRELICSVQRDHRITTLLVTHDQEEAVTMSDRIVLLDQGRTAQSGSPSDFYERPATAAVARFFGGTNFISCQSDGVFCSSPLGRLRLQAGAPKGQGLLTFRPEQVKLGAAPENALQAMVTAKTFVGTFTKINFMVQENQFEMWLNPAEASPLKPGDNIIVHIKPEALWIVPQEH